MKNYVWLGILMMVLGTLLYARPAAEKETLRIGNRTYAIIGLERIGGIMVYDISNPESPAFYDYINTRDFSKSALAEMGDLGPEGICAVAAANSPTRKPLIFVANEVSGTIAVFEMQ